MDAFTQKLLERTQARKEQLALKRRELEDCRANRTPPRRKPLIENNNKQLPDKNGTNSLKENNSIQSATSSPIKGKVDISAKTDKSRSTKVKEAEAGSPSLQARRERLIKMQQKDQENGISPKKHWRQLPSAKEDASIPSVATRSAAFQSKVNNEKNSTEKRYMPPLTKGDTNPKVSATRNLFEKGSKCNNEPPEEKSAKQQLSAPPKPPRLNDQEEKKEKDAQQPNKRKAPLPPQDKPDPTVDPKTEPKAPVPRPRGETHATEKSEACDPVWAKRQRTESDDLTDGKDARGDNLCKASVGKSTTAGTNERAKDVNPKPTPRKRGKSVEDPLATPEATSSSSEDKIKQKNREEMRNRKKAKQEDNQPVIAAQKIPSKEADEEGNSTGTMKRNVMGDEPTVIQACAVTEDEMPIKNSSTKCGRESVIRVQTISSEDNPGKRKNHSHSKNKHISSEDSTTKSNAFVTPMVVDDRKKPNTERNQIGNEVSEFKVPDTPAVSSHGNLNETMMDLNETVNLNDVNIHEITFNIDISKFDKALQQDRESMFKTSFEERCKKEEEKHKEKRRRSKSVPDDFELTSAPPRPPPPTVHPVIKEGKVHQSGYTAASEHFATSTTPKSKKRVNKPKNIQAKIQSLLEEAASQQNIVLQASQLLNCCAATNDVFQGSPEEVEAERVLLVACEHRTACLDEVQRLKTARDQDVSEYIITCDTAITPCVGKLTISDIRLPLRQEFMDVLRLGIRSDLGVFHFVCLIQHGPSKMFCSRVRSTYDATEGSFLSFPDKFVIDDLTPDFNVDVRVFCMNVKKNLPILTTTPKHKLFQSPKVGKKFSGRKGIESSSPVIPATASPKTVFRTSCFTLVGCTSVTLPLIKSGKFSLDKVPQGCPLNNFIQFKADCTPQYSCHVSGFLTILEDVGGYGAWQRRWCVLDGDSLQYWRYPGDEAIKPPLGTLNLSSCISEEITTVSRDLCARPNTMEMIIKRTTGPPEKQTISEIKYLLAADNKADRVTWINTLNEALKDWKAWNTVSVKSKLSRVHNKDVFMCSVSSPKQV